MKKTLNKYEAIAFILIITITQIILNMPEYLINLTGTGTIVNILYVSFISLIFCFITYKLIVNFPNFDILDIAQFLGGIFLKFIVGILFIAFFMFSSVIAITNFSYLIKSIYFKNYSTIFMVALFLVPILIANIRGITSIKRCICFFTPILIISIFLLCAGTSSTFDIQSFFPVFGYDYSTTFVSGLQNIFIFNFIWIYFFIMPSLRKKNDLKPIIKISFLVNIILILFAVIAIFSLFPTTIYEKLANSSHLNTIYLITRRIQINNFFKQSDILFMAIWILSIFCYTSFLIYGVIKILNKLFTFEDKKQNIFSIISILFGFCLLTDKFYIIKFLENPIFKYFSIILIFVICFIILLLGNLKRRKKKNEI